MQNLPARSIETLNGCCCFSLRSTVITLIIFSYLMYLCLSKSTVIIILIILTLICCNIAIMFLFVCIFGRKFGSFYDICLHGYLLSMVLLSLTGFFQAIYFPLSIVQTFRNWNSSLLLYRTILIVLSIITVIFQYCQRSFVESFLSYMQSNFV
ncbi:unnamed protein product [Thelazia callipaeda]|uniref:7TM GPCR serpentine receptor class x (Srx) domain-containing protein n=1 Tax=Thelazia callipaeda TaxID=103827 RepID=A0A0N5DC22_THECL|nr:unnamed protein product [Thelazia callipaeda]